ncbi:MULTISPECIES: 3-deoxy-D-manno-octulosonic acid transferase [Flavobacteriaceae]|uniref:3-deoxy-D-manno-octulosonic acid transferase n=2 Tax=Flavobacteriaceae TaxID=49546 RepID=A0A4Y8APN6_9FLAO|nr:MULTISPECIES: glycosyltransferase N-terminal domain-containing protein [Flavobacteriaceae]TEW72580.1 3-deoxy-D-manno-octulosonic acid transferase [Gramella jeungdoensis]GGK54576.1 3-deoxy-D-manno-octulosonic acid transferase [Lutibacter litoralis]
MYFLYNILIFKASLILKILALFNKKIKFFVDGRKQTFTKLKQHIKKTDHVIWMHCASLGEFEQGRPILEKLKEKYPTKKIVLTFFSPSGYEVRKNYNGADVVCYLPLDSVKNAKRFLDIIHPETAIFVKYEFWPNLLKELKVRNIDTILISGIFRKNQVFFKWYGGFMRKALRAFSYFFVQDKSSENLLKSIKIEHVRACGDTRFDRVYEITKQDNTLDFISKFKNNTYTLVAGSTWKEDEELLVDYINNKASAKEKFIIAPHNINAKDIQELKKSITKKVVLFSEKEDRELQEYQVFIIDTIGILTKVYSYADIAYVGGGYTKSGVHNVLEPATFGVPIIVGPNYSKFIEVIELVAKEACFSVNNSQKLSVLLSSFFSDKIKRLETGSKALNYVINKTGSTAKILKYLK